MRLIGVYKIQSVIKPERVYIGSSCCIEERWICHLKELKYKKHHSHKLQNHYNKYGKNDLVFSIIMCCDEDDLISIEQYFIDSYNPWFNICKIAGRTSGKKHTEEAKKKMSLMRRGKGRHIKTPEMKLLLSSKLKDRPQKEETIQKMKEGWELRRIKLNKPKSKYIIKKYGT